jgi:hypothetical protein
VAAMTIVSAAVLWWLRVRLGLPSLLTIEYTTWAAAATMTLYGTVYAQGLFDFSRFNRIRLISGAMPAALMLICDLAVRLTPAEAGAAYLAPTWCGAVLACVWLHRASHGTGGEPLSQHEVRSVWSYGWRSVASLSGLALNNSADQYALGFLVPPSSLGLYSVGAAAAAPLPSLITSFGMVGLPTVAALTGPEKASASWRILRRAGGLLTLVAPLCAASLPWLIPWTYGARYAAAVVPAELLLVGTAFAALTTVVDALLRAYGLPGVVSITQGTGGALTIAGTLLVGGRSLAAVAIVSSIGFMMAFGLGLLRLCVAMRHPRRAPIASIRYSKRGVNGATARNVLYRPTHARSRSPIARSPQSLGNVSAATLSHRLPEDGSFLSQPKSPA